MPETLPGGWPEIRSRCCEFLLLAQEIIARIEERQGAYWWAGLQALTERLNFCRDGVWLEALPNDFGDHTLAFSVMSESKGSSRLCSSDQNYCGSVLLQRWLEGDRDEGITVVVVSDPYLAQKIEMKIRSSCPPDEDCWEEFRLTCLRHLRSWIRAVSAQVAEIDAKADPIIERDGEKRDDPDKTLPVARPTQGANTDRDVIAETLNGQQLKLFKLLWGHSRWTYYGTFKNARAEKLWRGQPDPADVKDDTVFEALRKLQKAMPPESPYVVKIEHESRRAKIKR